MVLSHEFDFGQEKFEMTVKHPNRRCLESWL